MNQFGVDEYPAPNIKWHDGATGFVNENSGGVVLPKAPARPPAAPTAKKNGSLKVYVETATDLATPDTNGTHRYCISAFYYNEALDVVERRRTEPHRATSSSARPGFEECAFQKQIRVPYNSRQQFVQVAVYLTDAEGGSDVGDGTLRPFVGEAHVPIADPRSESLSVWPIMHGGAVGEQTGNLVVKLRLPSDEDEDEDEAPSTAAPSPADSALPSLTPPEKAAVQAPPPLPQAPSDSALAPVDVGDAVEIFSKSAGQWQRGIITKVTGSDVTVEYSGRQRKVTLNDANLDQYFRRVEEQRRTFAAGEAVEVFSSSAGRWVRGKVQEVTDTEIVVQYETPNGDRMRKIKKDEDYSSILRSPELPDPPPVAVQSSSSAARGDEPGDSYTIGDAVEIFSKSANAWMQGKVIQIRGSLLTVEYADRNRVVDLQASDLSDFFRRLKPSVQPQGPAPAPSAPAPAPAFGRCPTDGPPPLCDADPAVLKAHGVPLPAFPGVAPQPGAMPPAAAKPSAGATVQNLGQTPLPKGTAHFGQSQPLPGQFSQSPVGSAGVTAAWAPAPAQVSHGMMQQQYAQPGSQPRPTIPVNRGQPGTYQAAGQQVSPTFGGYPDQGYAAPRPMMAAPPGPSRSKTPPRYTQS